MQRINLALAFVLLFTLVYEGCGHKSVEKRLDSKLSQQESVDTTRELHAETNELIQTTPGLSVEQRARLSTLRDETRAKSEEMRRKGVRLRMVLVEDIVSPKYNEEEVELIKKRIRDVENERLTLLFDSVEKANRILGRSAQVNQRIVGDFMENRGKLSDK